MNVKSWRNLLRFSIPNSVGINGQLLQSELHATGLSEIHTSAYTEMGNAIRVGTMQAEARARKPTFSKIKLEDFAKEFAKSFAA